MTTSPPQPPQNPYPGQPEGYGPPPQQFPQYSRPYPQSQPQFGPGFQPQSQQPGPAYQQQPFRQGAPQPGYAPPMGFQCRFCGSVPAVDATVRGHQGMIILMRFLKLQGPFCRTCGIATVRDMTAKSLWQGWWGVGSSIINPVTMLMNIGPMRKFKHLPEPAPGAPGQPMDPGKPMFRRPAILGLLLPVVLLVVVVVANLATTTTSEATVGACVVNEGSGSNPEMKVVDCTSSDAEYRIIGKLDDTTDDSRCDEFEGVEASYTEQDRYTKYTLCLAPV